MAERRNLAAQERGVAAVERTLERHAGKSVMVGTHGNLLTLVLNRYDDRFDFEFWKEELMTPDVYEARFADGKLAAIASQYAE